MNNYREYDASALSSDPSFRRWVLHASDEDSAFWDRWLQQNTDRAETVEQARDFLVAVRQQYQSTIMDAEVDKGVARIVAQIRHVEDTEPTIIPLNSRHANWVRWGRIAAILAVIAGFVWQVSPHRWSLFKSKSTALVATQSPWIDRINTGDKPLTLLLTDGSVVTLEPESRLRYPRRFAANRRAVTLSGEAFFEVAHRPQQPFVVTTNEFTTTVLGTSFRVRSSSPQHRALVVVRSGKVAVQPRSKAGVTAGASPVVLTRNQQVMVQTQDNTALVKTPVQQEQAALVSNDMNTEQVFEDVAVAAVFRALEKQYGVTIHCDQEALANCFVNTAFEQENLRERLSAVCQAVGATYQITDSKILISSTGCTL